MPVEIQLPPQHFKTVIRGIKRTNVDRAGMIQTAASETLKRLGVKPKPDKAIKGMPEGSNQMDVMSIIVWMKKVERNNKKAVRQVVAIEATATQRISG